MKINRDRVREIMKSKNIKNQVELAEKLGMSKNQISNILSERFNPIKSNIVQLSELLEVSPLDIIE